MDVAESLDRLLAPHRRLLGFTSGAPARHGRVICSCGALIARCGCRESHRVVEIRTKGCARCQTLHPRQHNRPVAECAGIVE